MDSDSANGERGSRNEQFLRVYDELRAIARQRLGALPATETLQATGLVHEAWLRLQKADLGPNERDTEHFFATAAQAMRWILVDRARRRQAGRRQHERAEVTVGGVAAEEGSDPEFVLDLDAALTRLEAQDPRKAEVVLLRHYSGLSVEATAEALGVSTATVKREWTFARAWLLAELEKS